MEPFEEEKAIIAIVIAFICFIFAMWFAVYNHNFDFYLFDYSDF